MVQTTLVSLLRKDGRAMPYPEQPMLQLVWPTHQRPEFIEPHVPSGYAIRTYQPGDEHPFLALMAVTDFDPWDDAKLQYNLARIIPDGWFFALDSTTQNAVGTAMCLHNYSGHTPFTGDVGWVACHPAHRGHGVGYSLTAAVTNRFRSAGYTRIQLGTEYYRLPAIKTYLKLGYLPRLYCPEMYPMWEAICAQIAWPFTPETWR
jgi:mycothiol synthase